MLKTKYTAQFKRDYRRARRRGCDPRKLERVIRCLAAEEPLPCQHRDGPLQDDHGYREMRCCEIEPGWELIYQVDRDRLLLKLIRAYAAVNKNALGMPADLSLRQLLRSPAKTALTFLLIAAVTFGLVSQVGEFAVTTREYNRTMALYRGTGAVDTMPAPKDAADFSYGIDDYSLQMDKSDLENAAYYDEGEYADYIAWCQQYGLFYEKLTREQMDRIASLPQVTYSDTRYMTGGISDTYLRLDESDVVQNYTNTLLIEGTFREMTDYIPEDAMKRYYPAPPYLFDFNTLTFEDCSLLGGVAQGFEVEGQTLNVTAYGPEELPQTFQMIKVITYEKILQYNAMGNTYDRRYRLLGTYPAKLAKEYGLEYQQNMVPGNRYAMLVRYEPITPENEEREGQSPAETLVLGDKNWDVPQITDVTGAPENYLEMEAYADLRQAAQILTADARTFDVVYTYDMNAIESFAQGTLHIVEGRRIERADTDAGRNVCVISFDLAQKYGLQVGDTLDLTLNTVPLTQNGAIGAIAADPARFAPSDHPTTLEIVGVYGDEIYADRASKPFWSYTASTVFVPKSLLPFAESSRPEHEFSPAEFSFVVEDPEQIVTFTQTALAIADEEGLRLRYDTGNWNTVMESFRGTRTASLIRVAVLGLATAFSLLLAVYLFISRKRKDYAVMRALGTTAPAAARGLLIPFGTVTGAAVLLGCGGGMTYLKRTLAKNRALAVIEGADLTVPGWIVPTCLAALLAVAVALTALLLGRMAKQSPLELLQDRTARRAPKTLRVTSRELTEAQEQMERSVSLPRKMTGTGKHTGFAARYVWRHIRRAGLKSALALVLAALLLGAVGQLNLVRQGYERMVNDTVITAKFISSGTVYDVETGLVEPGYVEDYYYKGVNLGDIYPMELQPDSPYVRPNAANVRIVTTNDLAKAFEDRKDVTVTFAEGYDESVLNRPGELILLSPAAMERYGVEPGSQVKVAANDRLYIRCNLALQKAPPREGLSYTERLTSVWDEVLAYMEESTVVYTVIGTVDTKDPEEYLAVAPVSNNKISPIYWGSRLAVLDAYLTGPEHVDQVREYLRQKFPNAANKYNLDAAKVEGLQRTVYILKTIYPMVLAAALVIGGFLAALAIVQSAKEAAILRILGTTRRRTRAMLSSEQIVLAAAGLLLGAGALLIWRGAQLLGISRQLALFGGLYLITVAAAAIVCAVLVTRRSVLELLQTKE
ncbi:MAG: type II toxin-antitoxin system mRNA interferase toxin, RelE/StbE family [Oscillospiraceae bacterium]|nr:type II toxin-antitoxin system mRNA interferase toxin, RelE/StbE family [Oscillospiraceae bacterium]